MRLGDRRRLLQTVIASLVVLAVIFPRAAIARGALEYRGPDGCPSIEQVRQGLAREASQRGIDVPEDVALDVERRGDRFVARLRIGGEGARRERTIEAASCAEAVESLLFVALLGTASTVEEKPAPPPPASPPSVEGPPPAGPPEPEREGTVFLTAAAGVAVGWIPSAAGSARIGAGIAIERFVIDAYVAMALPNDASLSDRRGAATFLAGAAGARGCFRFGDRVSIRPCAGLEEILIRGTGRDADATHDAIEATPAPTGALVGSVRMTRSLAATLEAAASLPLRRPQFTLDGAPVHRIAPATMRLALGAELWF